MNRRSILGVIAGAPFAGKAIAETAVGGVLGIPPPSQGYVDSAGQCAANRISEPLVERSAALRTVLADKQAMSEIRDEMFREHRVVLSIDPDIMAMRSWSPMAKVTFQRQRNVERAIEEAFGDNDWNKPSRYVRALAMRLEKIMWGR